MLSNGIKYLEENQVSDAKIDANLLLEYVLDVNKVYIIINGNEELTKEQIDKYMELIRLRADKKPLQYIIGHQEFMGLDFIVNKNVLIPRQDTEVLVLEAINCIEGNNIINILEIGTGSGCIPISICENCKEVIATTVDISDKAIEIAKKNAIANEVSDRITFIQSNLLSNVDKDIEYELFISNPPYIKKDDINDLMIEVKDHEPINALDGGKDGLYFYREISKQVKDFATKKSYILYEVGHNQSIEVKNILEDYGYTDIEIIKDLAGINRVVKGVYRPL